MAYFPGFYDRRIKCDLKSNFIIFIEYKCNPFSSFSIWFAETQLREPDWTLLAQGSAINNQFKSRSLHLNACHCLPPHFPFSALFRCGFSLVLRDSLPPPLLLFLLLLVLGLALLIYVLLRSAFSVQRSALFISHALPLNKYQKATNCGHAINDLSLSPRRGQATTASPTLNFMPGGSGQGHNTCPGVLPAYYAVCSFHLLPRHSGNKP